MPFKSEPWLRLESDEEDKGLTNKKISQNRRKNSLCVLCIWSGSLRQAASLREASPMRLRFFG
ncbi:hypothetical protein [Nostoc sp.]|uniref:hypothetical protein n=1 Tax=Nostoc sp. TaxID=1180 RepID=UPI002FF54099